MKINLDQKPNQTAMQPTQSNTDNPTSVMINPTLTLTLTNPNPNPNPNPN